MAELLSRWSLNGIENQCNGQSKSSPLDFAVCCASALHAPSAQAPAQQRRRGGAAADAAPEEKPKKAFPVTDPLVISKCGTCHAKDDKGNLSRISWERTTPEGWEEAIKRMVRLNGLTITPAEAKPVVKYLSTYHGWRPKKRSR